MGKRINKDKIVTYGAVAALVIAGVGGAGISLYESQVDHVHEYCFFSNFNLEHQANAINRSEDDRFSAIYVNESELEVSEDNIEKLVDENVYINPDHVTNYYNHVLTDDGIAKLPNTYAGDDSTLHENAVVMGERVEVYDTMCGICDDVELVRVFKK